ncbi:MAG: DUF4956 domain-containing protein [Bacteroidales bacterium]
MTILQVVSDDSIKSTFELFDKLSPKFFLRLLYNLVSAIVLIRLIYLPHNKNKEQMFTLFIFNFIIFLITFLLNKVEMSLGAAFGLFAVFSILRYRTEGITPKDMTYLFLLIAVGMINAVSKGGWDELLVLNLIVIIFTKIMESNFFIRKEVSKVVNYDNIEMIKPENAEALKLDLENRMGVKINHFHIVKIDFIRDVAQIIVYYHD